MCTNLEVVLNQKRNGWGRGGGGGGYCVSMSEGALPARGGGPFLFKGFLFV